MRLNAIRYMVVLSVMAMAWGSEEWLIGEEVSEIGFEESCQFVAACKASVECRHTAHLA